MFNKFNLDNHYEEVSSNKKNNNYKKIDNSTLRLIAIVSIAFIGLLVFLGIDKIMNNKSITFRQDNSKDIVYTLYESKKADQKIPYFNTSNKDLQLINDNISKYKGKVSNVVLGCTHYPLIKSEIRDVLGNVTFYDGSNGIARRLRNIIEENNFIGRGKNISFIDSSNNLDKEIRFYRVLEEKNEEQC